MAKRGRDGPVGNGPATGFQLVFDQTGPLGVLVDIIQPVLVRVEITVEKTPTFNGVVISDMNAGHTVYIYARLSCNVEHCAPDTRFCVESETLRNCLRAIKPDFCLTISGDDSDNLTLRAHEPIASNHFTEFTLPTLVADVIHECLNDLQYEFLVEIDLGVLRSIVRNASSLGGEDVQFRVEMPAVAAPGTVSHTVLTIRTEGDKASQMHRFHSLTDTEGGHTRTIRTEESSVDVPTTEELATCYHGAFVADKLEKFLKSIVHRQVINMRLSPGKPLHLQYDLGPDDSYVNFVLAAKVEA
jgi:hypothetical protein